MPRRPYLFAQYLLRMACAYPGVFFIGGRLEREISGSACMVKEVIRVPVKLLILV